MKVYVGCSLTHASEAFKAFVPRFKEALAREGNCEVLEFVGLTAGTAADVYEKDLANVGSCDAMVAFVNEPSIGLGMEIHAAISLGKPLLCLLASGGKVTRMVQGAAESKALSLAEYSDDADAVHRATEFIRGLR